MKKTLLISAAALFAATPALSQEWQPPADPIPISELAGFDTYFLQQDLGTLEDSLSDDQLARRLSRLYRFQADLLMAEAAGNMAEAARILEKALAEVEGLANQSGIADNVRYRELYRTIVTEHDYYFGRHLESEYGAVFELRADIFAELENLEDPVATPTAPSPVVTPIRTTIPMTENRSVEQVRNWFLEQRREVLLTWMARAETYFPMIEQILAEEGLPDELKYLAVIESGLNPKARSRWHAVGMWQFMSATGRSYGLESDSWTDDRMDPVQATRAAARHLKDLYKQYDENWHVAMAGYNCSPRCIKRAIRANGGVADYWGMYRHLPKETRGYLPNFIAVAQIMSNPEAFGFPANVSGPEYAYDEIPVTGMLSVKTIARMVGATETKIKDLNPALRRNSLPPGNEPFLLRIPPGTASRFAQAFAELPEEEKSTGAQHVVRRGEFLSRIASRYGVTVSGIMQANNLRRTTIYPGQTLIVPVRGGQAGQSALAVAEIRTINWGTRVNQPIALDFDPNAVSASRSSTPVRQASQTGSRLTVASSSSTQGQSSNDRVRHTVKRGDTLSELADKYGTSVSSIKRLNNLRGNTIRVGQRLTIDASRKPAVIHVVRTGDNLTTIARRYNSSVSGIRSSNNLRSSRIYPGQRLTIPME